VSGRGESLRPWRRPLHRGRRVSADQKGQRGSGGGLPRTLAPREEGKLSTAPGHRSPCSPDTALNDPHPCIDGQARPWKPAGGRRNPPPLEAAPPDEAISRLLVPCFHVDLGLPAFRCGGPPRLPARAGFLMVRVPAPPAAPGLRISASPGEEADRPAPSGTRPPVIEAARTTGPARRRPAAKKIPPPLPLPAEVLVDPTLHSPSSAGWASSAARRRFCPGRCWALPPALERGESGGPRAVLRRTRQWQFEAHPGHNVVPGRCLAARAKFPFAKRPPRACPSCSCPIEIRRPSFLRAWRSLTSPIRRRPPSAALSVALPAGSRWADGKSTTSAAAPAPACPRRSPKGRGSRLLAPNADGRRSRLLMPPRRLPAPGPWSFCLRCSPRHRAPPKGGRVRSGRFLRGGVPPLVWRHVHHGESAGRSAGRMIGCRRAVRWAVGRAVRKWWTFARAWRARRSDGPEITRPRFRYREMCAIGRRISAA